MDPFNGIDEVLAKQKATAEEKKAPPNRPPQHERVLPPPKRKKAEVKAAPAPKKLDDEVVLALAKLRLYGANELLGPLLKEEYHFNNLHITALRKMKKPELLALLEDVEQCLASHSQSTIANSALKGAMSMLESLISSKSKYNVEGTTKACFDNQHFEITLERAKIAYGVGSVNMPPATELALIAANTALMVAAQNKMSESQKCEIDLEKEIELPTSPTEKKE